MHSPSLVPDNWYEFFFTASINDFWDAIRPHSIAQREVSFIERHLQLSAPARVLDVPCGSGRHGPELARHGHRVVGVDISSDAVNRATRIAQIEQLLMSVLKQDMKHLRLSDTFDGAICFGNSFGYLPHADMLSFLRALHIHLRPQARFIIDTAMMAESVCAHLKREETYDAAGYVFEITNDYDIARSRLVTHTVLRRGAEEWRQSFSHGVYTCAELGRMLETCGFVATAHYADLDDTPYRFGDPRLLLVAERM